MKKIILLCSAAATLPLMYGCLDSGSNTVWETKNVAVIVNEGDTAYKNGSINFFYEADSQLVLNPIRNDVINAFIRSVSFTSGGNLWVLCNNPDKIMIFDALSSNYSSDVITDSLATPRQTLLQSHYLFVSNWGIPAADNSYPNSYLQLYDIANRLAPYRKLPCASKPESMGVCGEKFYVATAAGVQVFNLWNLEETPRTIAPDNAAWGEAKQMVMDYEDNIWVSYTGGVVQRINTKTVDKDGKYYNIPLDSVNGSIAVTSNGRKIASYQRLNDGSGKAEIYLTDLTSGDKTKIYEGTFNPRSIGVNGGTGSIYTANAKSDSNSTLMVISEEGTLLWQKEAGKGTKQFLFFNFVKQKQ